MTQEPDQVAEDKPTLTLEEAIATYCRTHEFKEHTAKDGGRRYKFTAINLADWDDAWVAGRQRTRWTELSLLVRPNGKFVIAVAHRTQWQGEENTYSIKRYDTLASIDNQDLLDALREKLCENLNCKIHLSEIAIPLPE